MPIYRGANKVKPVRGDTSLSRVYRGSTLVWQNKVLAPFSYDFGFQDIPNLWWAPVSGYDYRTHASAERAPAWTFNGMLVAPDNSQPAYLGHLLNRQCDGDLEFLITFGDAMNTLSYPTSLIVKSKFDQSQKVEVAFGTNGIRVNRVNASTTNQLWSSAFTPSAWGQVRVVLSGTFLEIYNGGTRLGLLNMVGYIPDFLSQDWGYFGFGVMSTSGQWSSRIDRIQISGTSSYREEPAGRASTRRITLARNVWTEVAAIHVNTPMTAKAIQGFTSWPNISGVQVRIKVGGQVRITSSGDFTSLSNVGIGAYQWVALEAYTSNSTASNRRTSDGLLSITET